jgi:hypothetical protein
VYKEPNVFLGFIESRTVSKTPIEVPEEENNIIAARATHLSDIPLLTKRLQRRDWLWASGEEITFALEAKVPEIGDGIQLLLNTRTKRLSFCKYNPDTCSHECGNTTMCDRKVTIGNIINNPDDYLN